MNKRKVLPVLVSLLLMLQLILPVTTIFAATNSSILPPSNLAAQVVNGNSVKLTWSAVFGATGYNVYEITEGQLINRGKATTATFTMSNLQEGSYTYVVSTLSAEGESGPCAPVTATVVYPDMVPPAALTHSIVNGNDISLTWGQAANAQTYNLYQIDENGQQTLVASRTDRTYTVVNSPEGTYTYAVSAAHPSFGESPLSPPLTVTITHPVMGPPSSLTYTVANGNDVTLKWAAVPYATGYKIYEVAGDIKVLKSTVTGTAFTYANMPAGEYVYEMRSFSDRFGESAEGVQVTVTLEAVQMTAPPNGTFTIQNLNDIVLSWGTVPYASSYKVYQVIEGAKSLVKTATTTNAAFTNMPAGNYVYEVHSYSDRFGESAEGTQLSVTLGTVVMVAPPNLTFKIQNVNDIVLTWGAAPNANSYKVYQISGSEKLLVKTVTATTTSFINMPGGDYIYEIHSYSDRFGESAEGSQVMVTLGTVTMAAPGNFNYKIQNGNDIVLTWDPAANATNYKVYQIVNGSKVLKNTLTGTTAIYLNLPEGEYSYVVHSNSTKFGESAEGTALTIALQYPEMQPPSNVTPTIVNSTQFSLGWDAASYAGSYKVYQVVNGQKVLKQTVTVLKAAFTNMTPGDYTYVIHSVSSRFGESIEGTPITFTLTGETMQAPGNPTYTITNMNDITLKWTSVPYATSYKVYQLVDDQLVLKTTTTTLQASLTNMPEGDYTFAVYSLSSILGESPEGAEYQVSLVYPEIAAPANLKATLLNGNDIKLTWNSVTYATSYNIYQIMDGQKTLIKNATTTNHTIVNLPEGDYLYEVYAVNNRIGEAQTGSSVAYQLVHPEMQPPSNVTSTTANGNDVTLKWDGAAYATLYKIYQVTDGQEALIQTVAGTAKMFANMAVGEYVFKIRSYSDRFGESVEAAPFTFVVNVQLAAPETVSYVILNGTDVKLNWSSVTNATSYKVYQMVDGQKVLKTITANTNVRYNDMPEGYLTFIVHSYIDGAGESFEGKELSFEFNYPVMQVPGVLTKTINNGNDITLRWGTTAYATAYRLYKIVDGQKTLIRSQSGTSYTMTNLPEGEYSFEVHSYNTYFGESPQAAQLTFTLEWPVVQPPVLSGSVFNANNMTFTWQAAAWANEYRLFEVTDSERKQLYKGTALTAKVYNLTEGIHKFEITSYNTRFGESAPSQQVTQEIIFPIMEPPAATASLVSDTSARIIWNFVTYANGYNVYEIVDGQPVLLTFNLNNLSYTLNNLSYGTHEYIVTSYSNSFGESESSNTVTVTLDSTPPVTTAQAPVIWTNQDAVVSFSATDNHSGVANTYYSVDGQTFVTGQTVTISAEGTHQVSYYSVDKAGNTEQTQTISVRIDKTSPITETNVTNSWAKEATVTLSAMDAESGVAKTYYSINGSEYVEGASFQVTAAGITKVSFYSVDQAGNAEEAKAVEVKIDGAAPVTTSDAPATWSKDSVTVTLSAVDAESGVAQIYYSINGSEYVEGASLQVTAAGITKVSFYSVDQAGNAEEAKAVEVKIDMTAPVLSLNVADEYALGENLNTVYTTEDDLSGIVSESMTIQLPGGKDSIEVASGESFRLIWPGEYTITVKAQNDAGLTATVTKKIVVYVPIPIEVTPKVIKGNNGEFTVRVDLPVKPEWPSLNLDTVTLNEVKAKTGNKGYYNQAKNGQFKFERSDFQWNGPEANLELRGYIGNVLFIGHTTVKVQR